MVELFEQDIKTNYRQSSKGNQLKWENNKVWYKADYTGYEGLAEYVVSHLLKKSTLQEDEYVIYDLEKIVYGNRSFGGVRSKNFLSEGWQIITLERLFKSYFGEGLFKSLYNIQEHTGRLEFLVKQVERITGLRGFGQYMNKLLTIDAFFLNEDRHTHNMAVLMDGVGNYAYCPIFDNGAALLSDTNMEYPINNDVYELMRKVNAKTICKNFDEQLDISEKLYGSSIRFNFTRKDVREVLEGAKGYYSAEEISRVDNILSAQIKKYEYLFD